MGWAEPTTCAYVATLTTPAVCRRGPSSICGSNNYDFSLAGGSEYSYTSADGTFTYYFQPCGQVRNAQCNANNATASSMMCQVVNGQFTTNDIAFYDGNLVSWYRIANGWQLFVQDGTSCGTGEFDYARALTVNFICGPTPLFLNMTEPRTCMYTAFIMTPQACGQVGTGGTGLNWLTGVPSSAPVSYETVSKCGGIYNLLPLSTADLTWEDWQYVIIFRPCGAVTTDSNCTVAAAQTPGGWMMCQDSKLGFVPQEGSTFNQYTVSWTPTRNPPGVLMRQADGSACGIYGPRVTQAYFICNRSATTAVMFNFTEGPTCTYSLYIWTNLSCPTPATYCGGAGYDITTLTGRSDLSYTDATSTYYFAPCGTVQSSQCQANLLTQSAMMCQATTASSSAYNLAVYAPQVVTWTPMIGYPGVTMALQDGSTCDGYGQRMCPHILSICAAAPALSPPRCLRLLFVDFERVLLVNFLCGIGGSYQLLNVTEQSRCYYVAYVNTGMTCAAIAGNGPSSSAPIAISSSAAAALSSSAAAALSSSAAAALSSIRAAVTSSSSVLASSSGGAGGMGVSSSAAAAPAGGGGSSSLSGGAIAGIVIGSVVGALVLVGLLLLLCCGSCAFGRKKTQGEGTALGGAGGKYGEFDSEPSRSNIEMETTAPHGEGETA